MKADSFEQWIREWQQYKTSMMLNWRPLLPAILKQTPTFELNKQVSLHNPAWYELTEVEAINLLKQYAVTMDLNEVNNIELQRIK